MAKLGLHLEPETHSWAERLRNLLIRFSYITKKRGDEYQGLPRVDFTAQIPTDTLSNIFIFFVQSTTPAAIAPCVEAIAGHGPMLLSHVSRRWRHIAIDETPSLWANIYVGPHPLLTHSRVMLVQVWLLRSDKEHLNIQLDSGYACPGVQRPNALHTTLGGAQVHQDGSSGGMPSKGSPLAIGENITAPSLENENQITLTEEMFRLFATHINRWRSFSFAQGSSPEQPGVYLSLHRISLLTACSLRQLSIHVIPPATSFSSWMSIPEPSETLDAVQALPHSVLEHLQFHWEHPLALQPQLFSHPLFSHLSRIRLSSGLDMYQTVTFLFACTSAVEVRLDCIHDDQIEPPPPTLLSKSTIHIMPGQPRVATLPNLKVLQVADCIGDFTKALDHLCCPAMDVLEFRTFEISRSSATSLETFLERSKCQLSRLSVVGYNRSVGNEMMTLLAIPALDTVPTVGISARRQWRQESLRGNYELLDHRVTGTWVGKGPGNVMEVCSSFLFC